MTKILVTFQTLRRRTRRGSVPDPMEIHRNSFSCGWVNLFLKTIDFLNSRSNRAVILYDRKGEIIDALDMSG